MTTIMGFLFLKCAVGKIGRENCLDKFSARCYLGLRSFIYIRRYSFVAAQKPFSGSLFVASH